MHGVISTAQHQARIR